jgi:hypothetical protein
MDYDPACFDIKSRTKHKDYRVLKIDHEEILCKPAGEGRCPSWRQALNSWVLQTIERANSQSKEKGRAV